MDPGFTNAEQFKVPPQQKQNENKKEEKSDNNRSYTMFALTVVFIVGLRITPFILDFFGDAKPTPVQKRSPRLNYSQNSSNNAGKKML